ncbi:MAG: cytochrome c biogenesis heme-transporting ATPase CcmA [Betaproteobacteria bacterium]
MLEGTNLECERGGRVLFRALGISLKGGELVRIAGENGSGKTSLLRILCGLLTPTAGEVRWRGERIESLKEEYSRELVYVGHAAAVKDDLTAEENLAITCRLAGSEVSAGQATAALERMGVPLGRPLRRMSQGQRRRAALARLCVSGDKPLWFLDEPLAALDARAAQTVEALVRARVAEGGSVVFTTHQDAGLSPTRVIELQAAA